MIDTHCHLNFAAFKDDWREVADRAVAAGVEKMIVVGADLDSSRRAVELAQAHPALYAAVGIHPHHARQLQATGNKLQELIAEIAELTKQPRVVAIGEIGIDNHVYQVTRYKIQDTSLESQERQEIQKQLFAEQLKLAVDLGKPVILHSREAKEEVLQIISNLKFNIFNSRGGVFHCFGGSKKYAQRIVEAGFYLGFDGDVTYVPDRLAVAATVPLDRLLLETDSPYLTPVPYRGGRNQPANLPLIAQIQAEVRNLNPAVLTQATSDNAQRLFNFVG
ncbi:hypothetical protein A2W24_01540 [Microgenomates group bacterium RBG_16_45_19]|nr:MAG: hypothetical protein A2W24_01540 [Microgenomates group bacterium RBG_16_45_19]